MSNLINKIYKNNAMVYKVLLFLISVVAIVYLFPKGGQFKYDFNKGKPWQYDNLYATFDFSIQKTKEELDIEKRDLLRANKKYFVYDNAIVLAVKTEFTDKINFIQENDSIDVSQLLQLVSTGNFIINEVYNNGFINEANLNQTIVANDLIFLRKDNEVEEIAYSKLLVYKEVLEN